MEQKKTSTYDRILTAAEKLFVQRGYQGTTTREIVKEAGASLSSFHTHFQSKENIYLELINRAGNKLVDRLSPIVEETNYLFEHGILHGELAWNLLTEVITKYTDWIFDSESRDSLILFNKEFISPTPVADLPNSAQELTSMLHQLCQGYTGDNDAKWSRLVGYILLTTLFNVANHPQAVSALLEMEPAVPENTVKMKYEIKSYLLVAIHAYLDLRKTAAEKKKED